MSIEERIILHLRLAGTVGVRVFGSVLPPSATMPAVTVQRISGVPRYTHQGRDLMRSRIQITTWASTFGSVEATSKAIRAVMDGFTCGGAGGRARLLITMDLGREAASTLFQQTQDYEVLHSDD